MYSTTPTDEEDPSILRRVANELETLRKHEENSRQHEDGKTFPKACRKYLLSLAGNSRCVDCGGLNPDWASVTYGTLLCVRCSGRHRSYGVTKSRVRSISMDAWSHSQVLAVLEGGNEQLQLFFQRHQMGGNSHHLHQHHSSLTINDRYQTKAALFYRTHLEVHVKKVAKNGRYQGRTVSRQKQQQQQRPHDQQEERQPQEHEIVDKHHQLPHQHAPTTCHVEQARQNATRPTTMMTRHSLVVQQ